MILLDTSGNSSNPWAKTSSQLHALNLCILFHDLRTLECMWDSLRTLQFCSNRSVCNRNWPNLRLLKRPEEGDGKGTKISKFRFSGPQLRTSTWSDLGCKLKGLSCSFLGILAMSVPVEWCNSVESYPPLAKRRQKKTERKNQQLLLQTGYVGFEIDPQSMWILSSTWKRYTIWTKMEHQAARLVEKNSKWSVQNRERREQRTARQNAKTVRPANVDRPVGQCIVLLLFLVLFPAFGTGVSWGPKDCPHVNGMLRLLLKGFSRQFSTLVVTFRPTSYVSAAGFWNQDRQDPDKIQENQTILMDVVPAAWPNESNLHETGQSETGNHHRRRHSEVKIMKDLLKNEITETWTERPPQDNRNLGIFSLSCRTH